MDLIIPIDRDSSSEYDISVKRDLRLEGMGSYKRKDKPLPGQGKLF
jgi:hypothetical protein